MDPNIESLRLKYSRLAEERDATLEAAMAGSAFAARIAFEAPAERLADTDKSEHNDALQSLRICIECKGLGISSSLYNHIVMSRTCVVCGGDGVVALSLGVSTVHKNTDPCESRAVVTTNQLPSGPPPLE